MGNGHYLSKPRVRGKHFRGKGSTVHETGALVVCNGCGRAFILIEDSDYARLLARAIAGPQKG